MRLNGGVSASQLPLPPSGLAAGGAARHLSDELQQLIQVFAERSVRLREVLEVTQGRGYTMLLIVLTLPFCTPIPMPGFSAPFGLVVAAIGFRLALGQKPWLPQRLLNAELPPKFFPRVLSATCRLARWLERILRPRWQHVLQWRLVRQVMGTMILSCGLLMILPLPIPFSNGLPAMAVLLLAAGTLEEDGYAAVAGGVVFVLTFAFFAAILWGGAEIAEWVTQWFADIFTPDDAAPAP
jgi:hypothetical protein